MIVLYTVDPVSINFESNLEICGADGKLFFPQKSRDESRILTVSKKKTLTTGLKGSLKQTVSSEVFESEISVSKCFKVISFFSAVVFNLILSVPLHRESFIFEC